MFKWYNLAWCLAHIKNLMNDKHYFVFITRITATLKFI